MADLRNGVELVTALGAALVAAEGTSKWALGYPPVGATGSGNTTSSSAVSASITTTAAKTIVVAAIFTAYSNARTVSTVTDTSGATWQKLASNAFLANGSTYHMDFELWWAPILTAQTTTVSVTLSGSNDFNNMILMGFTGCRSILNPFDCNAAGASTPTPAISTYTNTSTSVTPSQTISVQSNSSTVVNCIAAMLAGTGTSPVAGTINGNAATVLVSDPDAANNNCSVVAQYALSVASGNSIACLFGSSEKQYYYQIISFVVPVS